MRLYLARLYMIVLFAIMGALLMAPASANADDLGFSSCDPIARLYGDVICRKDVEQAPEHRPEIEKAFRQSGIDPAQELHRQNRQRFFQLVWEGALVERFGVTPLTPTEDEITTYHNVFKNTLRDNYLNDKENIDRLKARLKQGDLEDDMRKELTDLLLLTNTSVRYYEQNQQFRAEMPAEYVATILEAERKIASAALKNWRADKALFDAFGGRVFVVDDQLKPLDAYLDFLGDMGAQDNIVLIAADYQDLLETIMRDFEAMQNTSQTADETQARAYFKTPDLILTGYQAP